MNSIRSSSDDCIFVILVEDEMNLLRVDSGRELPFGGIDEVSLKDISSDYASVNASQFEENGNRFLTFSSSKRNERAFFQIYLEEPCVDDIPCAFFNQETKQYENFNVPYGAKRLDISIENDGHITVGWDTYDEDEEELEEDFNSDTADYEDLDEIDEPDEKTYDLADSDLNENESYNVNVQEDMRRELEAMRSRLAQLQDENYQLQQQVSPVVDVQDTSDLRAENDRLRKLVSQLIDNGYNGDFEQTLDAQIDERTQMLVQRQKVCQDKQRSLERLLEEKETVERNVSDITQEINQTIELIQKGENILQESSSKLDETQKLLQEKLQELGIDETALRMYQSDQFSDHLLQESEQLQERIENKLKELISVRQKDAEQRFDQVTS